MNNLWPFINPFGEEPSLVPLLREAFVDWKIGYGIFDALEFIGAEVPWKDSADSILLDIEYFGNRSGGKYVSPVIMNMLDDHTELSEADRVLLARIIWVKFGEPWKHLWDTNVIAYNPIHNYNMVDKRSLAKGESETKVGHGTSVDETEHGRGNESTDYTYGINNTDENGKRANRTASQESGTTSVNSTDDRKDDSVRASNEIETTERSGNIGVTTTQQMLTAERELWMWNFFDQVYKDIDTVLSLPIYDPCRI